MKKLFFTLLVLAFSATTYAHSVWINAFHATTHQPSHVILSLGWGHTLPMDDILNSTNGIMQIENLEVFDPDMKKTALILPPTTNGKPAITDKNFDIFPGDLAVQKIAFKKNSKAGVYQFALRSKPNFYTQYIDKKGKEHLKLKPKNEIKDIAKVLMAVKFEAFAKTYATVGKWKKPQPIGHGLEIMPLTDLSNVKVGDLVEVAVLFYGKPISTTAENMAMIVAHSDSFGQADGFNLCSYLIDGKAQFRVQSAGQWAIDINLKSTITKDGPLKNLVGKAEQVFHAASLTFTAK